MPIPRNELAALLADIDEMMDEAIQLATERNDDEALSRLMEVVADLQEVLEDVAKVRVE